MGRIQKAVGRSRTPVGVGYLGPIPADMWELLETVWESPLAVSSNIAREHAPLVALAASLGWLSTVQPSGQSYGRLWRITAEGLVALRHRGLTPTRE